MSYPRMASIKSVADFEERCRELGIAIPIDEQVDPHGPLASAISWSGGTIGNRFAILPMEGWDAESDGKPSDLTRRRWERFGLSGAKLIWGGEAVAVRHDGRANPNQLILNDANFASIAELLAILVKTHEREFGTANDLLVGLQLTHSGRFARPNDKKQLEPMILYRHPLIEQRYPLPMDYPILTDDDLYNLIDDFIDAAVFAQKAGFAFVDVKHCHGYLGHELLSAVDRPGAFGGSFENRTRFVREIVAGIRANAPGLGIGVRLSVFDFVPFRMGVDKIGEPILPTGDYRYAFGGDSSGLKTDLAEPIRFLELLRSLEIDLLCSTAGSPYYNPHIQRPATFPPSDGYLPPEDPLVGVARQMDAVATLKRACPEMVIVGSAYSYLQDWLPNVGQAVIRHRLADAIGFGRMVLSYPELPADVLSGRGLQRKKVCRTFSDCTTAPRNGMVSGCYPLDPFYKDRPERNTLAALKITS